MRGWEDLGVVGTIYEEEQEEEEEEGEIEEEKEEEMCDSNSISPSPTLSLTTSLSPSQPSSPPPPPPPPTLESRVDAWSRATGNTADVAVRVNDRSFRLHRDPMISRSGYLRRLLTESSDVAVTPPSGVTAETFADIAAACYGSVFAVTPSRLPALCIAAEWLAIDDDYDDGGVFQRLEECFQREVAGDAAAAAHVLRECLKLLPAAAAACLAGRCVETLSEVETGGGEGDGWIEDVVAVAAEEFGMIAESMRARMAGKHDLLYKVLDQYLESNERKLREEEKNRICSTVDCTRLSHHILMHLIQNPRMPLRYIVQAMLLDQLHTRRSLFDRAVTIAAATAAAPRKLAPPHPDQASMSLGAILNRDAAVRQAAHIRATMDATNFRIESLERDLEGIKRRLRWSEEKRVEMESARSASFRFFGEGKKAEEEEEIAGMGDGPPMVGTPGKGCSGGARNGGGFGRKLMNGLKSVFRMPLKKPSDESQVLSGGRGGGVVVAREERRPRHHRSRSFV